MPQTFGWLSAEAACASCRNLALSSSVEVAVSGRSFSATTRFSFVSSAL